DWTNNEGSIYGEGGSTGKSFIPGNTTACVAIVYDINGNQKPNVVGKDIGELNAVLGNDDCVQVGSLCVSKANVTYSAIDTTTDKTYDDSTCGEDPQNPFCAENRWAGAKKACADLSMYLPSRAELVSIYTITAKNLGIKSLLNMSSGAYWSSTKYSNRHAWGRSFPSGVPNLLNKGYNYYTRCIK
ncbi:MAG: hypothetical protein PHC64_11050, partial [Candidatus Gastranaerophilales bacterium]|nr:hypothetical protein [Candidatus Gastranaerophilales bacterium]